MYRRIQDFIEGWAHESESTLKVFERLTRESLDQRVTPEGRSLRDLAWHITLTLTELPNHAGLGVKGNEYGETAPETPEEIIEAYRAASKSVAETIPQELTDEKLTENVTMYGQVWTYGATLRALIDHQTHHRGQMTVLMRQAGLIVPGVYGPAKEEWAAMGMEAQA